MTLLRALSNLREDFPVLVITRDDEKHVEPGGGDATRERDSGIEQTRPERVFT